MWRSQVQLEIYLGHLSLKIRGGVAHRRIAFTQVKAIARSEQLRDRSVTFGQKGSPVLNFKFEQFIEHTVMFL
jgi:hypothetical protein